MATLPLREANKSKRSNKNYLEVRDLNSLKKFIISNIVNIYEDTKIGEKASMQYLNKDNLIVFSYFKNQQNMGMSAVFMCKAIALKRELAVK